MTFKKMMWVILDRKERGSKNNWLKERYIQISASPHAFLVIFTNIHRNIPKRHQWLTTNLKVNLNLI